MLKGQDVVVLLKLLDSEGQPPVRELAGQLGFDVAGTHRALRRLDEAGLYSAGRQRALPAAAEEFLIHAVKFVFPARWGSEARGVPTAWAAAPLMAKLASSGGLPPVWPHAEGTVRGLEFEALHPIAPVAALRDLELGQRLALVDALRANEGPRITNLAEKLLKERIGA